jgi:hypothetical protein
MNILLFNAAYQYVLLEILEGVGRGKLWLTIGGVGGPYKLKSKSLLKLRILACPSDFYFLHC